MTFVIRSDDDMVAIENLKDHVIICGYGLVGEMVADILSQHDIPFVVIEMDHAKVEILTEKGINVVKGDCTSAKTLRKANITKARALAVVLDDDAKNLFAVITAKSLNSKINIATRANEMLIKDKLREAGAGFIATPNQSVGDELFDELLKGYG